MKEYRPLWVALGAMALLSPVGLYLPRLFRAGEAWGEWSLAELAQMLGYLPAGMRTIGRLWTAPMSGYALPRQAGAPLAGLSLSYILSALLGIGLCAGGAHLLARRLTKRDHIDSIQTSSREQEFFEMVRARRLRPARSGFVDKTLRRLTAFFSDALLREKTARRAGLLQRLDPRARLLGTLLFILSVSLARSIPVLVAHAALVTAAVWLSRLRLREILGAGFLVALLFSSLMALPATLNLVSGGEPLVPLIARDTAWRLGPYTIPAIVGISREGLLTAATFLLRTLSSVAAVLCLTLSTRWMDLLRALRFLRLPPLVVQTLGITVRYLHVLLRQSEEAHLGKKSRTLTRRPLVADQMWVGSRIAYAWQKSLRLVEDVGEAMTTRGFTGEVRLAPGPRLRAVNWLFLAAVAGLCLAAHLA